MKRLLAFTYLKSCRGFAEGVPDPKRDAPFSGTG
jgi:hypothetical protein